MVKTFFSFTLLWFLPLCLTAQTVKQLSLPEAYALATNNYPLIKQKDLVQQTAELTIENLQKDFLPQVSVLGQATYQSDVIRVPATLIGFKAPPKDQYKLVADVSQLVYDGGAMREQKILQRINAAVEEQKIEVELYRVRDRVNQFYLGMLYLDQQLKQVDLVKTDIQTGIRTMEAQVNNGVAFKSNLNMMKAELLKADQRAIEILNSRKGLKDALSLFIGKELPDDLRLVTPPAAVALVDSVTDRPELRLYDEQTRFAEQQNKLITAKNLPRASLIVQGGYARPGLDPLETDFSLYYLGGIRLNWSIANLYTKKRERQLVEVNKKIITTQKETFLLNTNTELKQQESEIDKLQKLVATDNAIISLRKSVTDAAKAQLENGVITANDYLKEVNAEDQARQVLIGHQVQLLQAQINYQTISGKQ